MRTHVRIMDLPGYLLRSMSGKRHEYYYLAMQLVPFAVVVRLNELIILRGHS